MNYSCGNFRKLFTYVLLNEDVPDVETIYFALIEQEKENCIKNFSRCVSNHEN